MIVAIFFAQGFEETEAIMTVDLLKRAGCHVKMIGLNEEIVIGAHDISVKMDVLFKDWDKQADCFILPGGLPGTKNLAGSDELKELIIQKAKQGSLICAICAAPAYTLEAWGLLKNKKATGYPSTKDCFKQSEYMGEKVVVDGNIITSQAIGTLFEFNFAIVEALFGKEKVKELKERIIYKAV